MECKCSRKEAPPSGLEMFEMDKSTRKWPKGMKEDEEGGKKKKNNYKVTVK